MRSSVEKKMIRIIAGLLMVCMLFPMLPAAAVEETEAVCTCGTVEGVHGEECALYEVSVEGETTPETTEPETTEPETTEPEVTEPETTEPEVTEPEVTEPKTTEPEVTEPETAEPESTEPVLVVEDEHKAKKLNEGTPTMTVTFDGLELTEDGVVYNGWDYDVANHLTYKITGMTPEKDYKVKIELDQIVYYEPVPQTPSDNAYRVEYKQNEKLPYMVKGTEEPSYYLKDGSGTLTISINAKLSEWSFDVPLMYDPVLWNRKANASILWDASKPLIKVTLFEGDTEVSSKELTDATSGKIHEQGATTRGVKCWLNGDTTGTHKYTGYYINQKVIMQIRGFTGNYYYDTMELDIDLPTYTAADGTQYPMEIESIQSSNGEKYKIEWSVSGTKATVKVRHIYKYGGGTHVILNMLLKFPDSLKKAGIIESGNIYKFPYKVTYHVDGDTFVPDEKGEHYITLDGSYGGKLEYYKPQGGYVSTDWAEGTVASLGTTGLVNSGNVDCEDVVFRLTFDKNNDLAIGVTSVNLMTDTTQKTINVLYTLMDAQGNIYPETGTYDIELDNPYYNKATEGTGRYITLYRGMVTESKDLYFKTVEYKIGTIPAGMIIGKQYYPRDRNTPGSFWGHALREDVPTSYTKAEIVSATSDGIALPYQTMDITTKYTTNRDTMFSAYVSLSQDEIYAGNGAVLKMTVYAHEGVNVTQTHPYLDELRVGMVLPKGIEIRTSTISASLRNNGKKIPVLEEQIVKRDAGDGQNNVWILPFAKGYPMAAVTENLKWHDNGRYADISFELATERSMSDQTLLLQDIMYVSGNQWTAKSVGYTAYSVDIYDINGNGATDDPVIQPDDKTLTIYGNDVSLDITDELLVNGELQKSDKSPLYSENDKILYRMNLKNENGGSAEDFASYFRIPQNLRNGNGDKIVMSAAGTVENNPGSTEMKWMYTTQAATDLETVQALPANAWTDSVSDWTTVTWARLVTADGTGIKNGSEATVTIPLKYSGAEYSYHAGASAVVKSEGSYYYVRGLNSTPIGINTIDYILSVHYKESSAKGETTLTAALDRKPTAPNVNTWTFDAETGLNLKFYNPQTFKVENLVGYNVELVDVNYETVMKVMSSEESNKKYMIKAGLTSAGTAILDGLELGTLAKDVNASFVFELYNGNILTDAATQRYVTFDLVSEYVTIPVKINIQQEATLAEAGAPAIVAGKRYAPITDSTATSVSVSKDSAFTAQFVVDNMNANYGARTLIFGNELPAGTTIVLIDYAELTAPRYARYVASGDETQIALTSFAMMGSTAAYSSYTIPAGSTETSFKEQLLFVVDFPEENGTSNSVKLKITNDAEGEGNDDVVTSELMVTTAAKRGFSADISSDTTVGSEFTLSATITAAGAADSRYDGRQMAFVIDGSDVPADGKLTVDGVEYKRNSQNQYIISMGVAQNSGTYSKKLVLEADSLDNGESCTLTAELWVSATAQAAKPRMGECVVSGLSIKLTTEVDPSLKVDSMSQRVLTKEELKSDVSLVYKTKDIPSDAKVTLEVQKAIGSTYITGSTYAEQVTGSTNVSMGVYTVPGNGGNLTLRFSSSLDATNYQILFKVTDSNDNVLLEVPYRFVVVD